MTRTIGRDRGALLVLRRPLPVCAVAAVLTLTGCQTATETSGPRVAAPSAGAPDWVKTKKHPAFPAAGYILGVGIAGGSRSDANAEESAKASALAEIAEQISVDVQSEFEDRIEEEVSSALTKSGDVVTTGAGKQISKRITKTKVDLKVEAAQGVEPYYDAHTRIHYCLWAADRRKWARLLATRIDRRRRECKKFYDEANRAVGDGEPMLAIRQYLRALDERVAVIKEEAVHSVVHTGAQAAPSERTLSYDAADVIIKLDRLIGGFRMEVVKGDKQRGAFGRPLPKPLTVRLVCKVADSEGACKSVPVLFSAEGIAPGKVELQSKSTSGGAEATRVAVATNSDGYAECNVTRTDYDGQPIHLIGATADLNGILPGVKGLAPPKVTFTYYLRTPATTKVAVKVFGPPELPKVLKEAGGDFTSPSWFEKHMAEAVTQAGFTAVEQGELTRRISDVATLRNAKDADVAENLDGVADIAVLGSVNLKHTGEYKVADAERRMLGAAAAAAYNGVHIFQLVPSVRVIDVWSGDLLYSESWPEKKVSPLRMDKLDADIRRSITERNAIAEKVVNAIQGLFDTTRGGAQPVKRSKKREFKIQGF